MWFEHGVVDGQGGNLIFSIKGKNAATNARIRLDSICTMARAMMVMNSSGIDPAMVIIDRMISKTSPHLVTTVSTPAGQLLEILPVGDTLHWIVGSSRFGHAIDTLYLLTRSGIPCKVPGTGVAAFQDLQARIARAVDTCVPGSLYRETGDLVIESMTTASCIVKSALEGLGSTYGLVGLVPGREGSTRGVVVFLPLTVGTGTGSREPRAFVTGTGDDFTVKKHDFILRFKNIDDTSQVASLVHDVVAMGHQVGQSQYQVKHDLLEFHVVGFQASARLAGGLAHHGETVVLGTTAHGCGTRVSWRESGSRGGPGKTVRGPVVGWNSTTRSWAWIRDKNGDLVQHDFAGWLDHYYPAPGGFPAGASWIDAWLTFTCGGFPRGNALAGDPGGASLTAGAWKSLPPVDLEARDERRGAT